MSSVALTCGVIVAIKKNLFNVSQIFTMSAAPPNFVKIRGLIYWYSLY